MDILRFVAGQRHSKSERFYLVATAIKHHVLAVGVGGVFQGRGQVWGHGGYARAGWVRSAGRGD